MNTLDKRNEKYGLDHKVLTDLACRHEIMNAMTGTGVSVQELINALCEVLDGENDHDIVGMVADEDLANRIAEIRRQVLPLWTYSDGKKVVG